MPKRPSSFARATSSGGMTPVWSIFAARGFTSRSTNSRTVWRISSCSSVNWKPMPAGTLTSAMRTSEDVVHRERESGQHGGRDRLALLVGARAARAPELADHHGPLLRIDDPVLAHARPLVKL